MAIIPPKIPPEYAPINTPNVIKIIIGKTALSLLLIRHLRGVFFILSKLTGSGQVLPTDPPPDPAIESE